MRKDLTPAAALLAGAVLAASVVTGCGGRSQAGDAPPPEPKLFTAVTAEAGIDFVHAKPVLDAKLDHIMPWVTSVGAAVAAADFDRDGWIDLYVTSSHKGAVNHLYRNRGDGTFEDVAAAAGLAEVNGEAGVSMDAVWGDVDADGWPDLYLVRWGRDALFHNQGDGTFTEITDRVLRRRDGSPGTDWANGNAAIFLDYDRDGRLDLYVGNYFREVDLWHLESTRIMHDSFEEAQNGGLNFLFHQRPDGTFEEVAAAMGVEDPGWTLAAASADVDNNGWPDLWCADDFGPDRLFLNHGDGRFANVTETALGLDTKKGMNVDFGDFNNDGWLDAYVTNVTTAEYLQEGNMLWHNNGPGPDGTVTLTDVSLETGTYDGGWGWGAKFFDYDLDGDLDLVAMNGFISAGPGNFWYDLASWIVTGDEAADAANWPPIGDRSFSGYERTRLWRNDGGAFSEQSKVTGLDSNRDGRGVAVIDFDNDGDLDLYLANQGQPPDLYRNQVRDRENAPHWLGIALVADPATGTNPDALGARVTVVAGGERQIRERDGGNGYAGQSDPRLHFGLGAHDRAELVEVRWPDGGLQYLEGVAADQYVTVRQDPAAYSSRVQIEVGLPERRQGATADYVKPEVESIDPQVLDRQLSDMERTLGQPPLSHALAAAYRRQADTYGANDRAIRFFTDLAAERPDDMAVRLELGSAKIDKVPSCGGLASVVCKGILARQALDEFDEVVERDPDSWAGHYARGINHLHWPRGMAHSDDAAADLSRALELEAAGKAPAAEAPRLLVRVSLGDAYARDRDYAAARRTWRRGLEDFPDSEALKQRLAFTDDQELDRFVEAQCSLEADIDTDFVWLDPGRGGS